MVIVKEREFQLSLRRVLIVVGRVLIVVDHPSTYAKCVIVNCHCASPHKDSILASGLNWFESMALENITLMSGTSSSAPFFVTLIRTGAESAAMRRETG